MVPPLMCFEVPVLVGAMFFRMHEVYRKKRHTATGGCLCPGFLRFGQWEKHVMWVSIYFSWPESVYVVNSGMQAWSVHVGGLCPR